MFGDFDIHVRASRPTTETDRGNRDRKNELIMSRVSIAKLGFVIAAGASFLFSVSLWFSGSREEGVFVGLWVPSILSFGTLILGRQSNGR